MQILKGDKLQEIAYSSESANAVLKVLSKRERIRHHTDINRFKTELKKNGEMIVDTEFIKLWKDLEAAGVGSIVHGRNGRNSFFKWNYSLVKISRAALEGKDAKVVKIKTTVIDAPSAAPVRDKVDLIIKAVNLLIQSEQFKALLKEL